MTIEINSYTKTKIGPRSRSKGRLEDVERCVKGSIESEKPGQRIKIEIVISKTDSHDLLKRTGDSRTHPDISLVDSLGVDRGQGGDEGGSEGSETHLGCRLCLFFCVVRGWASEYTLGAR